VDHFKETNDRFGHGIGDLLLEKLATTVTNLLPEGALLARIGGEEFCLLLPRVTLAETEQWAERICLESNRQTPAHQRRGGDPLHQHRGRLGRRKERG